MIFAVVAFFALATAADYLVLGWHRARESGDVVRLGVLSMVLESISWVPFLGALEVGGGWRAWTIAGACVLGSAVGAVLGLLRHAKAPESR